jgi:PAS domain S-box-containing protein
MSSTLSDQIATREQLLEEVAALRARLAELESAEAAKSRQAESVFGALVESAPDAMVIVDQRGEIVLVNTQTELMFGFKRAEMVGQPIEFLVPERFRSEHVRKRNEFIGRASTRPMGAGLDKLFGRRKTGEEFPVEISLAPLVTKDGLLVTGTVRDVSERKRAEAQLRKAEARYRSLVEEIPAVTFVASFDETSKELYVSPQIEALLGFTQKEWLEDPVLWHRQLHPDDRDRWNTEFAPTVSYGKDFSSIYRFVARDGRVVWVRGEAKVVKDDDGRPLFLQGVAFDITAIKQAEEELRLLNQTLAERVRAGTALAEQRAEALARSNASLVEFGEVAVHDLKAPLRTMKSFTEKLASQCGAQLDEKGHDSLTRINNGARRMESLLDALWSYSRVGKGKPFTDVEFSAVFAETCASLHTAIEESGAEVVAGDLPRVWGDKAQLAQLLQNLITNALKFRAERAPVIRVEARRQENEWLFAVTDNGIGIEREYLRKIFGLGVESRLHSASLYPGSGLGLATCEKIVQRHNGRIWADSPGLDQGTTIAFTLPIAPTTPDPAK